MSRNIRKRLVAAVGAITMIFSGSSISAAENDVLPQDGLIADYSFLEEPADGKTVENLAVGDDSASDAVVYNPGGWEDNALVFNGTGNSNAAAGTWVSLPEDLLSDTASATINIEVKADETMLDSWHFLWNIGNSGTDTYWFTSFKNSRASIKYDNKERDAKGEALLADRWYSLTAVIDAEAHTMYFYIDGEKAGEVQDESLSLAMISDQSRNTIGRAPYDDPMFKGAISSFRVYNRALTEEEIVQLSDYDAQLHQTSLKKEAETICENIASVEITDSVTVLPDYGKTVTWKSDMPEVTILENGLTAVAVQPKAGEDTITGTITAVANVRGCTVEKDVEVVICPSVPEDAPYGYLLIHFMGQDNADVYHEKVYMDISRGNNPEQWDPLNDGEPILASALGTTGVRDTSFAYNPETKTYYIFATDLRVFGGDNKSWGHWTSYGSTKINVWESKDLITWSEMYQFDVTLNQQGESVAQLGMMWAPEATWVEDYYGNGKGAFVIYWSSTVFADTDTAHKGTKSQSKVLWGVTTDFTQETYEFGGVFVEKDYPAIDTAIIQDGDYTYRATKNDDTDTIFFEKTDAEKWWLPEADWTLIQENLGKNDVIYCDRGIEGPTIFKSNSEERWYMYADDVDTYVPMTTDDLDKGWSAVTSEDQYLRTGTHHGDVLELTKAQYDAIRKADAKSVVKEVLDTVQVELECKEDAVLKALPSTAEANLAYGHGTAQIPVKWDISSVDFQTPGKYEVTGTLVTIGANHNDWIGEDGSALWDAPNKQLYSTTELKVTAMVEVVEEITKEPLPYEDVKESDWFYDAAAYTFYEKLMTGLDETHFGPYGQLSRAQFALILYRMEGEKQVETEKTFGDITGNEWYGPAVLWAAENGIVTGYLNGSFGPADLITREQMAVMMHRYAGYLKQDVSADADFGDFSDAENVSDFAKEAMKWVVGSGIITGKDNGTRLDPQGNTARAEAAVIIQRFME